MPQLPLSDENWARIEHLFVSANRKGAGRPRRDPRLIVEAVLWVAETGAKWHHLPGHYPPPQTCYIKWREWEKKGLMCAAREILNKEP
ncbi:transposase [Paraburkholderia phytofirmans]|uniref:Putative insertion element transposase n=1 Tax=Paraburkholderia phytofirmans (strain DSM 17436 / LMG 22146 / PsJN) TaxID=398527 RepID=B2TG22_PARPJ|nr:putative insertion element transposase [Paraburkholderia phytofirmans PsJN]